jgi:hypothetical protein
MRRTRILPLVLAVLMILALFAGCSQASSEFNKGEAPMPEGGEGIYDSNSGTQNAEIVGRKLIRTISIEAETKDLDALLTDLDAQLAAMGGYVQSKQIRGGANGGSRRYASLTLRIPADQLDQFINHVTGTTNILSNSETTEDVTLKFIATESRIAALEAEEARVMELIAKAQNLNELLVLESKLSDIRQELEEVKSQLKLYENLVDYGTVHLSVSEEREYTVVEEEDPTVWQRISTGFVKSLKGVGTIFTELFVFFVVASPYLAIPAAVVVIVVVCLHISKKKALKQQQEQQNQ